MEYMTIGRRQFSLQAVLALLSGVAITVSACGSGAGSASSSPTPTQPTPFGPPPDVTGVISANHGHSAVITSAQLTAANAISLDIQGTATHTHTVVLSATEVSNIARGLQVARDSTTTFNHTHTVTFN